MLTDELSKDLQAVKRNTAVIFGIEAHVCVLQTVLDLIDKGYEVHVAADAVSSQREFDRSVAFEVNRAFLSKCCTANETERSIYFNQ